MVCIHLVLLQILSLVERKYNKDIILPWIICSFISFIFPILPTTMKDSNLLM